MDGNGYFIIPDKAYAQNQTGGGKLIIHHSCVCAGEKPIASKVAKCYNNTHSWRLGAKKTRQEASKSINCDNYMSESSLLKSLLKIGVTRNATVNLQ